jgi:hypothetical protein
MEGIIKEVMTIFASQEHEYKDLCLK